MLAASTAQVAGSAVVPAVDAGKGIFRCLKHKYDRVRNLDDNFRKLEEEEVNLCDREKDIKGVIERNELKMEMTQETESWLRKANEEKIAIEKLKTRYTQAKKCLCGMCPIPVLLKLSNNIVTKTREVAALKDKMNPANFMKPENVMTERRPVIVEKKHAKKIEGVQSLNENVEELLEYLNDKDVKKIGIWGAPGVGKTTIMKNLNDKLENTNMFEIVIWVTVTREVSMSKMRKEIAERLRLNVEGINNDQVSSLISTALENKRYLLLLDEVFSEIDLCNVGIHHDHEHGKLVLASRYRYVCDCMEVDEHLFVERLSKHDAWTLFREIVGDTADHQCIKPLAEKILRECGELPQVIIAVARTLKKQDEEASWQSKLWSLRSPSGCHLLGMQEVFNAFRLVYDNLDEELRNCLLYGAFFPEDHEIYQDYLIECWKAVEFIGRVQTFREARNKGHGILKNLMDTSLLERCRRMGYVKMPSIFRVMARRMTHPHEEIFLSPSGMWREPRISLISTDQHDLPEKPECHTASLLFLQKNENLRRVPESFFDLMPNLNHLDLYRTGIESLPPSIAKLINLRGLYLNNCGHLVKLPSEIVNLENLEVLDIRCTGICSLPIEIGKLATLRCLRVSFTSGLGNQNHVETLGKQKIPSNLVKGLSLLEELTIDLDPNDPGWIRNVDGIAREVADLRALTSLHFHFPRVECLENFNKERQSWSNDNSFISFTIKVGSLPRNQPHGLDISGCSAQRHLRYYAGDGTPCAIVEVLKQACTFELIGHQTVANLSDFGVDKMKCLEVCIIEECSEMKSILAGNMATMEVFPYLKKLHIFKLQRLNCIWDGTMGSGSLKRLTTLTLSDCPMIEKIFSWGMTHQLPKLQHLKVENCSQLVKIIDANNQSGHSLSGSLPKLKILELNNLPSLDSICECTDSLEWPSLKKLWIKDCQNLQNLSLRKENAEHLSIECNQAWWTGLVFQNIELKQLLENRCCYI